MAKIKVEVEVEACGVPGCGKGQYASTGWCMEHWDAWVFSPEQKSLVAQREALNAAFNARVGRELAAKSGEAA